jgi:hypothetical protein
MKIGRDGLRSLGGSVADRGSEKGINVITEGRILARERGGEY